MVLLCSILHHQDGDANEGAGGRKEQKPMWDLMKKMRRNEFSFMLNSNWLRVEWKSGEPGSHEG